MATVATPMKKLLNDPADVVKESLAGLAAAHGDLLRYDAEAQILVRADAPAQTRSASISGGGSGHEPMHGGFVGAGHARRRVPGRGVHLAGARADAGRDEGRRRRRGRRAHRQELHGRRDELQARRGGRGGRGDQVESVLIDDDVAVQDSLYTAGRRGVGATVLAEKIAGAAAERGDDLAAVAGLARRVNEQARSFGVALSSCTPPAAGTPIFDLPDGEMEVGIGIHGEPGRERGPLGSAARDRRADARGGAERPRSPPTARRSCRS